MSGHKIETNHWRKPIPTSAFDWTATLDSYDGAPDAGHQPIGFGSTEQEAVSDLLEKIGE